MRIYLMYCSTRMRWFLCFGEDAVKASQGLINIGVPQDQIAVSQDFEATEGKCIEVDTGFGAIHLKEV